MTIIGPSKTESLSGYRLGVAFGSAAIIERMEKLQAIVSLRAPGYCQAVFASWFAEPQGWMEQRVADHRPSGTPCSPNSSPAPASPPAPPRRGATCSPSCPPWPSPARTL